MRFTATTHRLLAAAAWTGEFRRGAGLEVAVAVRAAAREGQAPMKHVHGGTIWQQAAKSSALQRVCSVSSKQQADTAFDNL
jgi:hypothetical protein